MLSLSDRVDSHEDIPPPPEELNAMAQRMEKIRRSRFVDVSVGDLPGLCKRCLKKNRQTCCHGVSKIGPAQRSYSASGAMQIRRDKVCDELWDEYARRNPISASFNYEDDFPLFRNDGNGIDGGQLDKMGLEAPACFWFRLRSKFSKPQLMTATSLH